MNRFVAVAEAARKMERERIVKLMEDYRDAALGNGEFDLASRLDTIIGSVALTVDGGADERAASESTGVEGMLAQDEQQEKVAFERALGLEEDGLPRVQHRTDEEDIAGILARRR